MAGKSDIIIEVQERSRVLKVNGVIRARIIKTTSGYLVRINEPRRSYRLGTVSTLRAAVNDAVAVIEEVA